MIKNAIAVIASAAIFLAPCVAHASPFAITLQPEHDEIEAVEPEAPLDGSKEPLITYLKEGQSAPFEGTLFSIRASADLAAERELADKKCQLKIDKGVEVKRAELQLTIDELNASLSAEKSRRLLEQDIAVRQIEYLSKDLERSQKQNKAWIVPVSITGGFVIGFLTVLVGAYAVKEVRELP